jgi:hypothetical protein
MLEELIIELLLNLLIVESINSYIIVLQVGVSSCFVDWALFLPLGLHVHHTLQL